MQRALISLRDGQEVTTIDKSENDVEIMRNVEGLIVAITAPVDRVKIYDNEFKEELRMTPSRWREKLYPDTRMLNLNGWEAFDEYPACSLNDPITREEFEARWARCKVLNLRGDPMLGTFTLTSGGRTTEPIDYHADEATVQASVDRAKRDPSALAVRDAVVRNLVDSLRAQASRLYEVADRREDPDLVPLRMIAASFKDLAARLEDSDA